MWKFCLVGVFTLLFSSPTKGLNILDDQIATFGVNVGEVTFVTKGETGRLSRNTRVPITLPSCQILSYVEVTVRNTIYTPNVTFDPDDQVVVITFGFLQPAAADYVVIAKSVADPACNRRRLMDRT